MSFSLQVKDELVQVPPKCKSCLKAMLSALVKSEGTLKLSGSSKFSVEFVTDNARIARFALQNFRELYNLEAVLTFRRNILHNNNNYLIELLQGPNLIKALLDLGIIVLVDKDNKKSFRIASGIKNEFIEKDCCGSSYLRGAFLANGYVSEPHPKIPYHFEIKVERKSQAEDMKKILQKKGIKSGVCARRNAYILYIKSGQGITDFMAYTGADKCALDLHNSMLIKQSANHANRQTNADMANSKRSTDAAFSQLLMIEKVAKYYGLENIPPAIRQFMKLRVDHQDASLSELGEYADPPLSKSAISGRLRRLTQLAKEIE